MRKIIPIFIFSIIAVIATVNKTYSYNFFLENPTVYKPSSSRAKGVAISDNLQGIATQTKFARNDRHSSKNDPVFLANEEPRNYDVLNYDLEIDWVEILPSTSQEPEKRKWNGKIKIKLTPLENNLNFVELDAVRLKINSIKIAENYLEEIPSNENGILKVPLETPINIGDTVNIIIEYLYDNPENRGFGHRNSPFQNLPLQTTRPSAGTLSQTNNSRYWFPCNDRPSDKAIFTVKATVPFGMLAASGGILDSTVVNYAEDEPFSESFFWRNIEPMPPYLFTVAASEYNLKIDKIKVNSTSDDSLEVYYYFWEEDWEGENFNFKRANSLTEKTIMIYSDLLGDYPFSKYGVAVVDFTPLGFNSVGMEHQTLTTVSRFWLASYLPVPLFPGFAHEIAHHWFGNLVTCHTWKDVWIQEGAASWLQGIYAERIGETVDKNLYYNQQLNHRLTYLNAINSNPIIFEMPIYGLDDEDGIFKFSGLAYNKASWIYHMLREWIVDDDLFFSYMRELLDNHRFGTITTEQFIDFWVEKLATVGNIFSFTPESIRKQFLEQWIYSAGHPQYEISPAGNCDQYDLSITLNQIQNAPNVPDVFLMPLEILFYKNDAIWYTYRILNYEKTQTFCFPFFWTDVDSVSLNLKKSLFEIVKNNTNINENSKITKNIFPNPLINSNEFFIELENESLKSIEIIDVFGRTARDKFEVKKINNSLATVKINSLKNGFYFIKLNDKYYEKLVISNGR